jgi:hypothetical protein
MIEIKDVKSIEIVPYTLMTSSISAVLALIYALLFIIIISITSLYVPGLSASLIVTLAIAIILLFPTVGFLISIIQSFLTAILYNLLVPRLGAIKLGFEDMNEIKNVPVVPFALMASALGGIIIFLIMLIVGPIIAVSLQVAASSAGAAIPGLSSFPALGIVGILIMVIGVPIIMFISIFIATAIMAIIYNLLAPKIGGIKFNFGNAVENLFEIESIPVVPFAIITTVVITLFGLITQVISFIAAIAMGQSIATQLISLVTSVLIDLVFGFIIYALTAFLYNYFRPKIGGIKLQIE